MTLRELKVRLAEFPPELDNVDVLRDDNRGIEAIHGVRFMAQVTDHFNKKSIDAIVIGHEE